MKLVWDGRADAVELRETYGVELRGVQARPPAGGGWLPQARGGTAAAPTLFQNPEGKYQTQPRQVRGHPSGVRDERLSPAAWDQGFQRS